MRNQVKTTGNRRELATLGGGCFWCLEVIFKDLNGVEQVVSGYSGGTLARPTYEQVCTGTTGHAEVVQVSFDPEVIAYQEILDVFFVTHDPTTANRQGNDVGTQYRSVVFYHTAEQKRIAEKAISDLQAKAIWDAPIVTEVVPLDVFYKAEGYHQGYFESHPEQAYCRLVIAPKVSKFRTKYHSRLKGRGLPSGSKNTASSGRKYGN